VGFCETNLPTQQKQTGIRLSAFVGAGNGTVEPTSLRSAAWVNPCTYSRFAAVAFREADFRTKKQIG